MMQTDTQQVGWQDYLAIVVRRRWFFLAPCLVVVVISLFVGLFLPKIFRAETVVLIQDQPMISPLIRGLAISTPMGEQMRVMREDLLSWTSLSRLTHELGMDSKTKTPLQFENMIRKLQRDITVQLRGREFLVIAYEDQSPELTQRLVNTLTNIYMDRSMASKSAEAGTAVDFLGKEMDVYKKKLEDSEAALREFKELYVMQMPVANDLNDQIVKLQVALAQLLVENTEEHPVVIQTRRQIDDLKRKRNEEIKRVVTSAMVKGKDPAIYQDLAKALDTPIEGSDASDARLRAAKEAYQAWIARMDNPVETAPSSTGPQVQVVAVPESSGAGTMDLVSGGASLSLAPREEQELARLTRDYQVYSQTYQNMQRRMEQGKVTQRLGESDQGVKFKVLEPARLPLRPIKPNFLKIFFFALLLGMFLGAGVAFLAEYLDQSFQSAEELQEAFELPVLGSISAIVTEQDLADRRTRVKSWMSIRTQWTFLRERVLQPLRALLGQGVDALLVRWKL